MAKPARRGFTAVEALLIGLFGSALGLIGAAMALPYLANESQIVLEEDDLRAAYGPNRHSQHLEEWIVRDFFQDRRDGFFLDVGANHYERFSNTYYLETALNWEGIAVEPLEEFAADYARYRPQTRFRSFFVSDLSDEVARLYNLQGQTLVSSGVEAFTEQARKELQVGSAVQSRDVPTITLDDLLTAEDVDRVDFLTMDIELWEPKALAGFDIERYRPALVCIEAHPVVRQQLLDYFARHGYVVVGRYLRADIWNLYFTPLTTR